MLPTYASGVIELFRRAPLTYLQHLKLSMQTLRTTKQTANKSLVVKCSHGTLTAANEVTMYADASFGTDPDNATSFINTEGQRYHSGAWANKRQACAAKSTTKAECMATTYAVAHLMCTR